MDGHISKDILSAMADADLEGYLRIESLAENWALGNVRRWWEERARQEDGRGKGREMGGGKPENGRGKAREKRGGGWGMALRWQGDGSGNAGEAGRWQGCVHEMVWQ